MPIDFLIRIDISVSVYPVDTASIEFFPLLKRQCQEIIVKTLKPVLAD
jgi:hypothetical protein